MKYIISTFLTLVCFQFYSFGQVKTVHLSSDNCWRFTNYFCEEYLPDTILNQRNIDSLVIYTVLQDVFIEGEKYEKCYSNNILKKTKNLNNLKYLNLINVDIKSIRDISKQFPELEELLFQNTRTNLRTLHKNRNLKKIHFSECTIKKVPMRISKLVSLKELYFEFCHIDSTTIEEFKKALPYCNIVFEEMPALKYQ